MTQLLGQTREIINNQTLIGTPQLAALGSAEHIDSSRPPFVVVRTLTWLNTRALVYINQGVHDELSTVGAERTASFRLQY